MRHVLRKTSITVALVTSALIATSQTAALAGEAEPLLPGDPIPAGVVPAPLPGAASQDADEDQDNSAPQQAAVCFFQTRGDYVHVSSSAHEASGHGWWVNIDCDAALADVTVQLQQYYSDGKWRNKGTVGRARVRSGGGAGNRATGRGACTAGSAVTGWRSVVDVDLVGVPDDPNKLTTPARNIPCRRA